MPRSDRAGILERPGEHRTVRVERLLELFGGPGARAPTVFEVPTERWRERPDMSFAQLARAGAALGRSIQPNGQVSCIERECRGGR